ncbi:unnamed protein product [Caenorhabditis angaria]|uniref:Protein kinase domain-containing protein n=1 Tax=Caenorhabditis angaria TaxID=860376 RepID=A0A9P1MWI4_9PELO|nr:unnamed protein product [Caenorhabditis angaria]
MSGDKIIGEFRIVSKIGEGGFGKIFEVKRDSEIFAMKIDSINPVGGLMIKYEYEVLKCLGSNKFKMFPSVIALGTFSTHHYFVMELLGDDLGTLKFRCKNSDTMTTGSWTRIGVQCLYSIKLTHDCGYLHRDIKPSNFALGPKSDYLKNRLIFMFDFGLARKFVVKRKDKKINESTVLERIQKSALRITDHKDYVWRAPRRETEFKGTEMYCSPNAHSLKELGPLPWANEDITLANTKQSTSFCELFKCNDFDKLEMNLRNCSYYDAPDKKLKKKWSWLG